MNCRLVQAEDCYRDSYGTKTAIENEAAIKTTKYSVLPSFKIRGH